MRCGVRRCWRGSAVFAAPRSVRWSIESETEACFPRIPRLSAVARRSLWDKEGRSASAVASPARAWLLTPQAVVVRV